MCKENLKTEATSEAKFVQLELEELEEWDIDLDIKTMAEIKRKIED